MSSANRFLLHPRAVRPQLTGVPTGAPPPLHNVAENDASNNGGITTLMNPKVNHSDGDNVSTNQAFTHMLMYYHHLAQLTAVVQQHQHTQQLLSAAGR
jgi:hypothetical protein